VESALIRTFVLYGKQRWKMNDPVSPEILLLGDASVVGPKDKVIIHVDDPHTSQEVLMAISDKLTSMFGDRSVLLVGNSIHINIIRGDDGTV
jgi:hypothetical protein